MLILSKATEFAILISKMLRLFRYRVEDYWLLAVSFMAVFFMGVFFYAGTLQLRLIGALFGLSGLLFTTYLVRRGYSRAQSYAHFGSCLVTSALLAYGFHLLTN